MYVYNSIHHIVLLFSALIMYVYDSVHIGKTVVFIVCLNKNSNNYVNVK